MNTIQFTPLLKEKTYELVNRALKNAQQNAKTVEINIFGRKFPVKHTDTYESVTPLKALLHTMGKLKAIEDRISA